MFPEKPMNHLTREEWREFNRARKCHICFKGFKEENPKVRDHCHTTLDRIEDLPIETVI